MIHVCFGLHDKTGRYSKLTGTAMLSIFENTNSDVTVHILHDNTLTQDNREKFIYLAGRYSQAVKFYNVEELCGDRIAEIMQRFPTLNKIRFSVATFYRFFIVNIFPLDIEKVIYFDSDIVVNLDVKKLWQIELGDKPLAAVSEYINGMDVKKIVILCSSGYVKPEDYLNAGVLLMNLKFLRDKEELLLNGIKFVSDKNNFGGLFDQDILNFLFAADAVKLPVEFNYFVKTHRYTEKLLSKKIYHYTATPDGVGLGLDMNDPLNRLWMDYFIKSPWFDSSSIGRLYETARAESQKNMINLSAAMSGKIRAFITTEEKLETLVEKFSVKEYEEIILIKEVTPIQKIIDAIKISRNEKIFFIMFPNFPFNILKEAGLIEGKDFLNAYDFLLQEERMPFKSYPLIKAL